MGNTDRKDGCSFQEACAELSLGAYDLRRLLSQYDGMLRPADGEPEASQSYLAREAMDRLKMILELRSKGADEEEILAKVRLADAVESRSVSVGAEADQTSLVETLLSRIEFLESQMVEVERRRVEDRDRALTVLARLQQEIQGIRNELAIRESRQARKKKGLFGG